MSIEPDDSYCQSVLDEASDYEARHPSKNSFNAVQRLRDRRDWPVIKAFMWRDMSKRLRARIEREKLPPIDGEQEMIRYRGEPQD